MANLSLILPSLEIAFKMSRSVFFALILIDIARGDLSVFNFRSEPTCGIIKPQLTNYIYGGKLTQIEQWPWQVRLTTFNA